jgi:hypothetical protein
MREWFSQRGSGLARLASAGVSFLLILTITYAGWSVVPHAVAVDSGEVYQETGGNRLMHRTPFRSSSCVRITRSFVTAPPSSRRTGGSA